MGSYWSTSSTPPPAGQKRVLGTTESVKTPPAASTEPLFLDEVMVEPATWSQEPICWTIQRFLGLLPDSPGEVLKKEQQYPQFKRRSTAFVFNVGNRMNAVITIQRSYRRHRRLRIWHDVSNHMLQLARAQLAAKQAQEQESISAASFRLLLVEGFSAKKVCIGGALKTIQLKLVLNPNAGECFLTWTPSRKKKPRINLHDIHQVIPVLKEGNPEAPRLAKKVSYRRGIIIVCKSYYRGRVVLEVATKSERNILLQGFQLLLSEMNSADPDLDDVGALRQHPRRQSVMEFFGTAERPQSVGVDDSSAKLSPRRSSAPVYRPDPPQTLPENSPTDSISANVKAIEHFYKTPFDEPTDDTISISSLPPRRLNTVRFS